MKVDRPGYNTLRMVRLMREAIARVKLDLSGMVIVTEAATGAYAVTPVIAALAGAHRVYAMARSSKYGAFQEVVEQTQSLAELAGVQESIEVVNRITKRMIGQADIITNSGHVRPIDARKIGWMKSTAVIPLMYEDWEFRSSDIDLEACRRKGVRVVGTNERHPDVDVFGYLGVLAMKELMDAGISVYRSRILLLADNPFGLYIKRSLERAGAEVYIAPEFVRPIEGATYDAILLSLLPRSALNLRAAKIRAIARWCPDAVVVQFYGDMDRAACTQYGVRVWPENDPGPGHMGILLSDIGPEPIIRLQAGGLKSAEVVLKNAKSARGQFAQPITQAIRKQEH